MRLRELAKMNCASCMFTESCKYKRLSYVMFVCLFVCLIYPSPCIFVFVCVCFVGVCMRNLYKVTHVSDDVYFFAFLAPSTHQLV